MDEVEKNIPGLTEYENKVFWLGDQIAKRINAFISKKEPDFKLISHFVGRKGLFNKRFEMLAINEYNRVKIIKIIAYEKEKKCIVLLRSLLKDKKYDGIESLIQKIRTERNIPFEYLFNDKL